MPVFFLLSKIIMENVLCFKLLLSKKQEDKNLFGGPCVLTWSSTPMLGQKMLIVLTGFTKTKMTERFWQRSGQNTLKIPQLT